MLIDNTDLFSCHTVKSIFTPENSNKDNFIMEHKVTSESSILDNLNLPPKEILSDKHVTTGCITSHKKDTNLQSFLPPIKRVSKQMVENNSSQPYKKGLYSKANILSRNKSNVFQTEKKKYNKCKLSNSKDLKILQEEQKELAEEINIFDSLYNEKMTKKNFKVGHKLSNTHDCIITNVIFLLNLTNSLPVKQKILETDIRHFSIEFINYFSKYGLKELNTAHFNLFMRQALQDPYISRHDTDLIFNLIDINKNGWCTKSEIERGFHFLKQGEGGFILSYTKRILSGVPQFNSAVITMIEVNLIFEALLDHYSKPNELEVHVQMIVSELNQIARNGFIFIPTFITFLSTHSPLLSHILKTLNEFLPHEVFDKLKSPNINFVSGDESMHPTSKASQSANSNLSTLIEFSTKINDKDSIVLSKQDKRNKKRPSSNSNSMISMKFDSMKSMSFSKNTESIKKVSNLPEISSNIIVNQYIITNYERQVTAKEIGSPQWYYTDNQLWKHVENEMPIPIVHS